MYSIFKQRCFLWSKKLRFLITELHIRHKSEIIIYEAARRYLKEHADNGTLPSLKYIKSAPGKFVSLDRLKAKRSELISKQKKLRTRYYSAKNTEKELYSIKRNVDNMLKEPTRSIEHKKQRNIEI